MQTLLLAQVPRTTGRYRCSFRGSHALLQGAQRWRFSECSGRYHCLCITLQEDEVESVLSSAGVNSGLLSDPLSRAALRLLWRRCRQTLDQPTAAKAQFLADSASPDSTWAETFPPKISHEALSTLKQEFSVSFRIVGSRQHAQPAYDVLAASQYSRKAWRSSTRQEEERELGPRFAKRSKLDSFSCTGFT